MMMMMSGGGGGGSRFPFTASQWQELEHQALVFKYMISGIPIPPDLLFSIRRSLDSSNFFLPQSHNIGWSSFHMGMGFGRKIDPEPGRCRRTDGKKWRCSKEAYPESKYCERHMHRGRNRSRKPVEILSPTPPTDSIHFNTSITNKTPPASPPTISSYLTSTPSLEPNFLYPHFPHSRPPEIPNTTTKFFLDSNSGYRASANDFRNSSGGCGLKGGSGEHSLFSESSPNSGTTLKGMTGCSAGNDFSWKLAPHAMSSPLKQSSSDLQTGMKLQDQISRQQKREEQYNCDMGFSSTDGRGGQSNKVMHHFFDEWSAKEEDSWSNSEDKPSARTQLSNSMHDFFMAPK